MKNKIEDLRNHLFETLEALKDDEKPMEIDRARAIVDVSRAIIDSAKAETQHLQIVGEIMRETGSTSAGTGFIPVVAMPAKPASQIVRGASPA